MVSPILIMEQIYCLKNIKFHGQNKYDKIIHSSNDYPVSELLPQELTQWEICSRKRLHLAETVWLNGIEVVVAEFTFHTVKGELIRNYKLCRKRDVISSSRESENLWNEYTSYRKKNAVETGFGYTWILIKPTFLAKTFKYFTYAIESSSIYCMPEGKQPGTYLFSKSQ